jgi:hypothetical protein
VNKPIQTLTTPNGERLVVLAEADYEELVQLANESEEEEDAELIAIANAITADPKLSDRLPPEVSRFILAGASTLKALRQWRDVGQTKLASDIGTSQGFVSDLENGRRAMTDDVRKRVAKSLDIPVHWL